MVIADIGSQNVNGTYRSLIEPRWSYVGVDIVAGRNVDLVMPDEYTVPVEDNHFDSLISGQCFEHTKNPFRLMGEIARIVKPGGIVLLVAPSNIPEHRYPVDCWRILGDGWRSLFDESSIDTIETVYVVANAQHNFMDSWGIGRVLE
jgi:SAM-dependent methyltransferase